MDLLEELSADEEELAQHMDKTLLIQRFRRPLQVKKKMYNDVYLTTGVPLCVYFRRCVKLLRWQLPNKSEAISRDLMRRNNINIYTGEISNKNKIYPASKLVTGTWDAPTLKTAFEGINKSRVSPAHLEADGIRIHAAGNCVTKAFYLLQDIYNHVKKLYLEGSLRFLENADLAVSCEACQRNNKSGANVVPKKPGQASECPRCNQLRRNSLERVVKLVLDVDIVTNTVSCVDDVWILGRAREARAEPNLEDNSNFKVSTDNSLQVTQNERSVSAVSISISFSKKGAAH